MMAVCFMMSGSYTKSCSGSTVKIGDQSYTGSVFIWIGDEDSTTFKGSDTTSTDGLSNIYVCNGSTVEIPVRLYIQQKDPAVLVENYSVVVGGASYPATLGEYTFDKEPEAALLVDFTIPFTAAEDKVSETLEYVGRYVHEGVEQDTFTASFALVSVSELPCGGCESSYDERGMLIHASCEGCGAVCDGNSLPHKTCNLCDAVCNGSSYSHNSCDACGAFCDGNTFHETGCVNAPVETTTIYFDNAENWETVYAFFWTESEEMGASPSVAPNPFGGAAAQQVQVDYASDYVSTFTTWPGAEMNHVSGSVYAVEVPVTANRILFNNGSADKTDDLTLPTDGSDLYISNCWSTMLKITRQPVDAASYNSEAIEASVEAQGKGLKYRWLIQNVGDDEDTWHDSAVKSSVYRITMTDARANRLVKCVVTDTYGNTVTSETALLERIPTTLEIIEQPSADTAVKQGENYKVTVKAKGDGLTYQWYLKNAGSDEWFTSAVKNKQYTVTMTDKRAGREIYCMITDIYGNQVESNHVFVTRLRTDLTITQQPVDAEAALNEAVHVSVTAKGDGLKYQWFIRNEGGTEFTASNVKSRSYDITMTRARANRQVYCVITDAYGETLQSETVTLFCSNK